MPYQVLWTLLGYCRHTTGKFIRTHLLLTPALEPVAECSMLFMLKFRYLCWFIASVAVVEFRLGVEVVVNSKGWRWNTRRYQSGRWAIEYGGRPVKGGRGSSWDNT